jgi:hypothetical protein
MPSNISWTPLGTKSAVAFYDPANTSNIWKPMNNPATQQFTPGNVRKYVNTTNGTSVIIGDREYPPMEIKLGWEQIDKKDVDGIRIYCGISPVVYVDSNDQGFLGVLMFDQAGQIAGSSANVWQLQASFLVIAPYNGLLTNINSITPPSLTDVTTTTGGYIPLSTTTNYWATVFTQWGESTPGAMHAVTTGSGTNTNKTVLSFTTPVKNYVKVRIYWSTGTNFANATFLTDVFTGASPNNSFTVYSAYNQYSPANPPLYGTAFTGYFAGGMFEQV